MADSVDEGSAAMRGSAASAFGDWFDAQFPPERGRLTGKTTDELLDMVVAGSRAQDELDRRQDRTNMERAALSAWMARLKIEADPASTQQVPRK